MAVAQRKKNRFQTFAELLRDLGGISPKRIRLHPAPGKATETDVSSILDRENRIYELVEGTLVEKIMGAEESFLACELIQILGPFAKAHKLGFILGADGTLRIMPGLVRVPDVSFISWDKVPTRKIPSQPIPDLVPDLAVEVLSKGNKPAEMKRKLKEYFQSGVRLVWFVDPKARTISVYTAPDRCRMLTERQTLDGGDVLPGFSLPLAELFAQLESPTSAKGKRPGSSSRNQSR